MRSSSALSIGIACVACLASCGGGGNPPVATPPSVVATVNGAAITEGDVQYLSQRAGAKRDVSSGALDALIRDELIYQQAVRLGLDRDESYRARLEALEAQLAAFKRQEMALRFRAWVQQQAGATDADVREYFEKNAALIGTRYHVQQIFLKGRFAEIAQDREELAKGRSFDEVAAKRFPVIPAGMRAPWDLGELRWNQLPPWWRGIVDRLEPGQVSDVIKGDNERFWIVKLVAKTPDSSITVETEREKIVETLRQQKATELYDRMMAETKAKARIVHLR